MIFFKKFVSSEKIETSMKNLKNFAKDTWIYQPLLEICNFAKT